MSPSPFIVLGALWEGVHLTENTNQDFRNLMKLVPLQSHEVKKSAFRF